jgi:hypothetical protein
MLHRSALTKTDLQRGKTRSNRYEHYSNTISHGDWVVPV